jgi:hypothetical protein
MLYPMQLRSVDAVTVVTQTAGPDTAIRREWARHDPLLEAQNLVGMLVWINTQR